MRKIAILIGLIGLIGPIGLIAETVDRVVAVIGSEIITQSDVRNFSTQRSSNARLMGVQAKNPLEMLIRDHLLTQEMERLGIAATDQDIDGAIQEVLARNRITLDLLKGELVRKGMTLEKYRKDLGDQIRRMKFMGQVIFPRIKITEEELAGKTGPKATDEKRLRARIEILQNRSAQELNRYLDEVREKAFVEIKK